MGLMNSLKGLFGGVDEDDADGADADGTAEADSANEAATSSDVDRSDADATAGSEAADAGDSGGTDADAEPSDAGEPGAVGEEGTPPTEGAEMLVDQATANGYDLDFSPESLTTLDQLVEDLPDDGLERAAAHFGAYLGEVFVRHYDGMWTLHDEVGWVVELPVGSADGNGTKTLAVPVVVAACLDGVATFEQAHDEMRSAVDREGPTLADDSYPEDELGPTLEEPASEAASEDVVEFYKDAAVKLVSAWTKKRLNYTPESIERLDDIVDEVYDIDEAAAEDAAAAGEGGDEADADVGDEDADDADEGGSAIVPADVDLGVPDGIEAQAFAGYVGEVFVRNYGAEWRQDGQIPVLVVEGATATAEIDPIRLVAGVFQGQLTFGEVHEHIVSEAGIETDD